MTGVNRDASSWDDLGDQALIPLSQIGCDAFECALLPIIRDLTLTCRCPEGKSWIPIYGDAEKRWGARTGLPLVHRLSQIVVTLVRIKGNALDVLNPADQSMRALVTRDEQLLLLMIHHMRRKHLHAGCDFLLDLVDGDMDAELMEEALRFAERHSCGAPQTRKHDGVLGGRLRVVR